MSDLPPAIAASLKCDENQGYQGADEAEVMRSDKPSSPWRYEAKGTRGFIFDADDHLILSAQCLEQPGPAGLVEPLLSVVVACVNACDGMSEPAATISEMGADILRYDRDLTRSRSQYFDTLDELVRIRAQRDALEAALAKVCRIVVPAGVDSCGEPMVKLRTAAIEEARASLNRGAR